MRKDNAYEIIKDDELICSHGRNLYEGYDYKESDVSYRMQLLVRLLAAVRKETENEYLSLTDIIEPSILDAVIAATRKVADTGPGKRMNKGNRPSTALKIGHELKHASTILYNMACRKTSGPEKDMIKTRASKFQHIHNTEWCCRITRHSLVALEHKRSVKMLLFAEDLEVHVIFYGHLKQDGSHVLA